MKIATPRLLIRSTITLFENVKGNARVLVITEGISNIAFQWYGTYLALYMVALGVDEIAIGWLTSALLFTQIIGTFLGGGFADRFGRKKVLVVGDIVCWGIPLILYAVAQNPWYLVLGRLINGFIYVVFTSFECLFVEDVAEDHRPAVYAMLQFLLAAGSLLAPVAGILVGWLGMVTGGRLIMLFTALMAIGIAFVRQFTMRETSVGLERMAKSKSQPTSLWFNEYLSALQEFRRDSHLRSLLIIRILSAISAVVWGTYGMIFLTSKQGTGLSESIIVIVPTISATITLVAVFISAERMVSAHVKVNLVLGQFIWLVGTGFYLFSPAAPLIFTCLWAVFMAVSQVLFQPALMSHWANSIDDQQRAFVLSVTNVIIAVVSLPIGPIAGYLYTVNPIYPFLFTVIVQLASFFMIVDVIVRKKERFVSLPTMN